MTRRVLIAWEFGSGLGHLAHMWPIILELRQRGCEPLVAVPDPTAARAVFGADSPRVISSVPLPMRRWPRRPPESLADLLLHRGFADLPALTDAVRGWQAIFRAEAIESVLLDYAHVAQLAAWLMDLPMVTWSTTFANPPIPIPCFRSGQPQSERAARVAESRLLECVNQQARSFGRQPTDSLGHWLHAPFRFTTGIRETNVFGFEPEGGYLGPLSLLPGAESFEWPTSDRTRVLCYLRWLPETPRIVAALKRGDRDILCVVPKAPDQWLAQANDGGLRATNQRVDLPGLMGSADVVVSNGSLGTACQALLAGKPQLLFPIDDEKRLITQKLVRQGLAIAAPLETSRQPAHDLVESLGTGEMASKARDYAARYASPDWAEGLARLADRA